MSEKKIWLTSDTHFNHNKDFIYAARGYGSVEEMNQDIIRRWQAVVSPEDEVYHLGDVFMGNNIDGMLILKSLPGHIHIIVGNHDSKRRVNLYRNAENVVSVKLIDWLEWNGSDVLLSHYPNALQTEKAHQEGKKAEYILYGHTHQTEPFREDIPDGYNVGMDAHQCTPILYEDAMQDLMAYRQRYADRKNDSGTDI